MQPDLHVELPDGSTVGYAQAGDPDGHPVLFLHGNPGSRLSVGVPAFRRAAEDLGVRLIAVDRPGIGLSTFQRISLVDYPQKVREFAAAVGVRQMAVVGFSGGGKYACACAWQLPDLVTRVTLVSSTCSSDAPGAKATWNKQDRMAYPFAARAPWVVRLMFAKFAHDLRRDPTSLFSMLDDAGRPDREILSRDDFRHVFSQDLAQAFRQGGRGPTQDYTIEARPWRVPLESIQVPFEIWCGEEDRIVAPAAGMILAAALPDARTHLLAGEGHLLLAGKHAGDILQSAVG